MNQNINAQNLKPVLKIKQIKIAIKTEEDS